MLRREHHVRSVVEIPVAMQEPSLRFQLPKEGRSGVWREDVKGGAFEPIGLYPTHRALEHVQAVVIESEHEAAVDLYSTAVQQLDSAGVVLGHGGALTRVGEIAAIQRFEPNEYARTPGHRHLAHQCRVIGDINRYRGAPDDVQRPQRHAQAPKKRWARAEIVVYEDHVWLPIGANLLDYLLHLPHAVRHVQTFRRQIAEAASVVAAASRNDAGRGEEGFARQDCAACRRIQ